MALQPLSAEQLAESHTLFASFMGRPGRGYKTVGQLLDIYRQSSRTIHPAEDRSDDLRVERFIDDMTSDRWTNDVVVRIGVFDDTVLLIDGIHRSIAYLACIEDGVSPDRLPALAVDR